LSPEWTRRPHLAHLAAHPSDSNNADLMEEKEKKGEGEKKKEKIEGNPSSSQNSI